MTAVCAVIISGRSAGGHGVASRAVPWGVDRRACAFSSSYRRVRLRLKDY
jgi:hypothetical protein